MEAPVGTSTAVQFSSHGIPYPTKMVEGFMLPMKDWVTLNRFRTNKGKCMSNFARCGIIDDANCDCGAAIHPIQQILNECPLTKYLKGLKNLHQVTTNARCWINNLKITINYFFYIPTDI